MHTHSLESWRHDHVFLGEKHEHRERRTWLVVGLTAAMMIAEIIGGTIYGSMALVADGWHMSTHAGALAIAALAYRFAHSHAHDPRFAFGTGKLGELAGFSSAIILALIALLIGYESVLRILSPVPISFNQATLIAGLGLGVNLLSVWLLRDGHEHHAHAHDDDGDHHHGHAHDHNLRAAYLHVLADATTSVLAIAGLLAGRFYGWIWMDPLMGIVGAGVIAFWSWGLIRSSGAVLLDIVPNPKLAGVIRDRLEIAGDRVTDLHLWRVGPGHTAVIAAVVSDQPQPSAVYKARLNGLPGISHMTIEVHACPGHTLPA
ncbi:MULTISPECIES: CDF family Co(II)/Ni(II) efflux transporter DmeF [Rhodomicrobium]|uniref:CDF family Co(II)/Ni(II) efflux transporter DmeF n=1 Tax=Rhodomicrobium TaxID=1068 RepID=UPI000B4AAED8|nr:MULTISPECIES: CDF family Co(II)/Ni(II) efflux transporter DmeF [Rhodomicrobium]